MLKTGNRKINMVYITEIQWDEIIYKRNELKLGNATLKDIVLSGSEPLGQGLISKYNHTEFLYYRYMINYLWSFLQKNIVGNKYYFENCPTHYSKYDTQVGICMGDRDAPHNKTRRERNLTYGMKYTKYGNFYPYESDNVRDDKYASDIYKNIKVD
jgi:hypothetical protein